jgi:hypothetical protein
MEWTKSIAVEMATGEREQETEEEMIERVQREEDSFEDYSSASNEE